MASTTMLGSYIWGFVSRRKREQHKGEKPAGYKSSPIVILRELSKGGPTSSPKVAAYDNSSFFDLSDAEQDYAQVLAEAKSFADANHQTDPADSISPAKTASVASWLARSPDVRNHNLFMEDAETVFQQPNFLGQEQKPAKSWKKLMFWRRPKKSSKFESNVDSPIFSNCATPMHHLFKSSGPMGQPGAPWISQNRIMVPKKSISGPIYYDGTPYTPARNFSSPLSASATPGRDGLYDPVYMPIGRPYRNYTSCPSPLYIP